MTDTVTEVVAVEPGAYLPGLAEHNAWRAPVPIRVIAAPYAVGVARRTSGQA